MAFLITLTPDAESQWRALPARERRLLEAAVPTRLVYQPTTPTKAVKSLRPSPFAEYELRVGDLLQSNPAFQALVAKSKAGPRKTLPLAE